MRILERPPLILYATVLLALQILLAVVSIAANWPSQFGGVGTDAGEEFVSRGTAAAPPLGPMLAFAAAIVLTTRRRPWRTVGVVAICVLALLFVLGSLGELLAEPTDDAPSWVLVASGIIGITLYGTLFVLGVSLLLQRRRE